MESAAFLRRPSAGLRMRSTCWEEGLMLIVFVEVEELGLYFVFSIRGWNIIIHLAIREMEGRHVASILQLELVVLSCHYWWH